MKKKLSLFLILQALFLLVSCGTEETTFADNLSKYVPYDYDSYQIITTFNGYDLIGLDYVGCTKDIDYLYKDLVFHKDESCDSTFLGMGYLLIKDNQFYTIEEQNINELELITYIPVKEEISLQFIQNKADITSDVYFVYIYDKDSLYHETISSWLKHILDNNYQIYAYEYNNDSEGNPIYPEYRDFIPILKYVDTTNDITSTFVGGEIYDLVETFINTSSFNHISNYDEVKLGYIGEYDIVYSPDTVAMMTPANFEYRGYRVVDGVSYNEEYDLSTIGIYAYKDGQKIAIDSLIEQQVFTIDDVMRFLIICEKIN